MKGPADAGTECEKGRNVMMNARCVRARRREKDEEVDTENDDLSEKDDEEEGDD